MTKNKEMRPHRIFNIAVAVLLVLLSAAFAAGALYIYYEIGEYTRETVITVFSFFETFVYVCLGAVVLSAIYEFISPLKMKKEKLHPDNRYRLARLKAKKDLENAEKNLTAQIRTEEKKRLVFSVVKAVVVCLSTAYFFMVITYPDLYDQSEINDSVIHVMLLVSPALFISGAVSLFVEIFNEKSLDSEIALLKKIPDAKGDEYAKKAENKGIAAVIFAVKICIVLAAIALIVLGAAEGGFADVMTKAVNICTECIGLG